MRASPRVVRIAAFTYEGRGGNPAGVVLQASGMNDGDMLRVAADVGLSKTVFLSSREDAGARTAVTARYFSPAGEVSFCGNATVAGAAALAEAGGAAGQLFRTAAGDFFVEAERRPDGLTAVALTSEGIRLRRAEAAEVEGTLSLLGWSPADLEPSLPPAVAYSGALYLVLPVRTRTRLSNLAFDPAVMRRWMDRNGGWATVHLVHREDEATHHVRGVFASGERSEDPATGGAAAAYGHYLRVHGAAPARGGFTCLQGHDMGVPCALSVQLDPGSDRVRVTGHAARLRD